jgi:hypothetical protein
MDLGFNNKVPDMGTLFKQELPQLFCQIFANAIAQRLATAEGNPLDRLIHAYHLALSRAPTPEELIAIRTFWMTFPTKVETGSSKNSQQHKDKAQKLALTTFCQALLASAEFHYLN